MRFYLNVNISFPSAQFRNMHYGNTENVTKNFVYFFFILKRYIFSLFFWGGGGKLELNFFLAMAVGLFDFCSSLLRYSE